MSGAMETRTRNRMARIKCSGPCSGVPGSCVGVGVAECVPSKGGEPSTGGGASAYARKAMVMPSAATRDAMSRAR
jgi:hypothetical protein